MERKKKNHQYEVSTHYANGKERCFAVIAGSKEDVKSMIRLNIIETHGKTTITRIK